MKFFAKNEIFGGKMKFFRKNEFFGEKSLGEKSFGVKSLLGEKVFLGKVFWGTNIVPFKLLCTKKLSVVIQRWTKARLWF
jgi:hypothetical protein